MKRIKKILTAFIFLGMSLLIGAEVFAENNNGADFSVEPIYPKIQEKKNLGYFSLELKESQEETVKIKVTNYSDKENKIYLSRTRATTASSGVIEYDNVEKEKDSSIDLDFNDIVTLSDEEITLPPNGESEVSVTIKMPSEKYEGAILGGIDFHKKPEEAKKSSDKMIVNTFSYSIPVVLKNQQDKIENELKLGKIEPVERNGHPYIEANIQNISKSIIQKMSIDGRIYNKKTNEEYYVSQDSDLKMAPNSTLSYGFDLMNSPILSGDYQIKLTIVADEKEYLFEDTFSISSKEANEMNEKSVYVEKNEIPWKKIILFSLIGLVIIVLIISFLVVKKKKKQTKKKKKGKKSKKSKRNKK